MNDKINYTLRAALKAGGGALVAKGLTDDAGLEQAIGALLVLIGFIWGLIKKAKADKQLPLLLFIAGLMFTGIGCNTNKSPERVTYNTIGTIAITVDAAMQSWGDYVRKNNITLNDPARIKVRDYYEKYQTAMELAQETVVSIKNNKSTETYSIALDSLVAVSDRLLNVIVQNIPPDKTLNKKIELYNTSKTL